MKPPRSVKVGAAAAEDPLALLISAFKAVAHLTGPDKAPALAEGIYHALITTCMGLIVAIPCMGGYSIFRNRADQLAAEAALTAEQVMGPLMRGAEPASAGNATRPGSVKSAAAAARPGASPAGGKASRPAAPARS